MAARNAVQRDECLAPSGISFFPYRMSVYLGGIKEVNTDVSAVGISTERKTQCETAAIVESQYIHAAESLLLSMRYTHIFAI